MVDVNALVKLADRDFAEEAAQYGADLPLEIKEALEEEIKATRKEAARAAARDIIRLKKDKNDFINSRVMMIRQKRAEIERLKKEMEEVNMAFQYAEKTMNYLPLVSRLGYISPNQLRGVDSKLFLIQPIEEKAE